VNKIIIILIILALVMYAAAIYKYIKVNNQIKANLNRQITRNYEEIMSLNKVIDMQEENIVELRGFNATQHYLLTESEERLAYEKDLIKQLEGKLLER